MYCNQIFALIQDNTVRNCIVCDNQSMADYLAIDIYGEGSIAIDMTLIPTAIGDTYRDGKFYRMITDPLTQITTETEIEPNPTSAEKITEVANTLTEVQELNNDLVITAADSLFDIAELQLGI